ncbi:uncharacterized protein LOC130206199 [Pseudoliparis swirei]|uniref:uncharacterized protein LOC130206199 n=1 Tax=Pseudoliparis swirei TaxID=2059687 RepID=UPI0024BDF7BF|nr:uncharacterized protein LOC130206199 [Pseudoliparis swirei]
MQPEEYKTEDKYPPSPQLSALIHGPKGKARSTCPSVLPPASSPFPSPNVDRLSIATPSTQSDSLPASCGLPSLLPLSPSALPDCYPASLVSPPPKESLLQSPENNHKDSFIPDSNGTGLCDPHKDEEGTPSSPSFQLHKNNAAAPSSPTLVSSAFEERRPTLPRLPPNPSLPVGQSALPSQSRDSEGLLHPAVGGISDLSERSICQHDDTTHPAPTTPVHNSIHDEMNHLPLNFEDTNQRSGNGAVEGERHTETVQTQETLVYLSGTESSADLSEGCRLVSGEVCNQTEIDPQLPSCSRHDERSTGTLPGRCQKEVNGSETDLHDAVPEAHSRTQVEPNLIKIKSLDWEFQTSLDGSEGDTGDGDAFFQQLDAEGRVYWAEPIQVSNPSPVFEESVSVETSDGSPGNSHLPRGQAVLDLFTSTGSAIPLSLSSSTTMDTDQMSRNATASSDTPSSLTPAPFRHPSKPQALKTSGRSVSVQMSSSLSSHIVHRKDVPYKTVSKRTLLPGSLPLDTSTPFRAVQSWTDLQIQRNPLTRMVSHGALHTARKCVPLSTRVTETRHGPTLKFSSSPCFPLLSDDWQSDRCLPGMTPHHRRMSVSVDKGMWSDEEEEVVSNGNEEEGKLWKENQTTTMACCCSCDHQFTCLTQKGYDIPYSPGELEEMMLCLQQFRSVLGNMEEQLSEEQADVYSALLDQDRETVRDIKELRRAVKEEAGELEMQLNDLADHYDDGFKMV